MVPPILRGCYMNRKTIKVGRLLNINCWQATKIMLFLSYVSVLTLVGCLCHEQW